MSGRSFSAGLLLALVLLAAAVAGLHWRHQRGRAAAMIAELPARPDLSRWPAEMGVRVAAAYRDATDSEPGRPAGALGELARLFFANGYAQEAARTLQVLARVEPENGRWPYLLALLKERADDRAGAEALFAEAARRAPDYAPALIHEANLQALLGRADTARRLFEHCLALAPDDPRVPYGLAKLDFARGDNRTAIARLQPAVRRFPQCQEMHLMLADLLAAEGDTRRAAEQRDLVSGATPSPPDQDPWLDETCQYCYDSFRLLSQGEARNVAGDFAGAVPFLQRAALLEPKDAEIPEALARAFLGSHRPADAEKLLRAALQHLGPNDLLYDRLSEVLTAEGRGGEALALLRQALVRRPGSAVIENAVGIACAALGRTAEAVDAFTAAARHDPIFADPRFNLGRCYLSLGKPAPARTWLEQGLKIRPEALDGLAMLTEAELQAGALDDAVAGARQLSRRGGNIPEYQRICVRTLFRAGNQAAERNEDAQAEQLYREGLEADDQDGPLHGALGMLYGKLHRYAEAGAQFEIFLRVAPRDPVAYLLLGSALDAEGRAAEARQTWRTGLGVATELQDKARMAELRRLLGE